MLRNYIKIAWRNLVRNKAYALINMIGLSVGIASCLLIFLFIHDELSYDQFHENADQIYRVVLKSSLGGSGQIPAVAKGPLSAYPEVKEASRVHSTSEIVLTEQGNAYKEGKFVYADSTFFDVFSFPLINGDPLTVLSDPNSIVLTKSAAQKYFGETDPMGRSLMLRDGRSFKVTGIMEDVPHNSHLQFNMLASFSSLDEPGGFDYQGYLYLQLTSGEVAARLESKFEQLTTGSSNEVIQNVGFFFEGLNFRLQPITDIHLYPALNGAIQAQSDVRYLYIFGVIGILILIIACINYMNLATANAASRAREVGMRKTLGARKLQLAAQFLIESIVFTGVAFLLALSLAQLLVPVFGSITGKSLSFFNILSWPFMGYSVGFIIAVGFLSGSYPVLVLSRFTPQNALKGVDSISNGKPQLRKALVVFQFAIAVALIAGTVIIQSQLNFIQDKRLGYESEHVLTIPMSNPLGKRMATGNIKPDGQQISRFKRTMVAVPGVQSISVAYAAPNGYLTSQIEYQGQSYKVTKLPVDYDYINTMKFELTAGRNFSKDRGTDSTRAVIINETAARIFNLEDKVGKLIDVNLGPQDAILIGIVKDFHTATLHQAIGPTVLNIEPSFYNSYVARLEAGSLPGVLNRLEAAWGNLTQDYPFNYHFLDDQLEAQYRIEQRVGKVFWAFSTLAIVIACLGLLGLATYTAQRRTKEIGIRKVLGATVTNIVGLLSKDFLKLVALGFIIAVPIAYYAMNRWLADFAYKIDISPGIFLLAGGLALLIALATVSWQSVRAALANPVDSLRSE